MKILIILDDPDINNCVNTTYMSGLYAYIHHYGKENVDIVGINDVQLGLLAGKEQLVIMTHGAPGVLTGTNMMSEELRGEVSKWLSHTTEELHSIKIHGCYSVHSEEEKISLHQAVWEAVKESGKPDIGVIGYQYAAGIEDLNDPSIMRSYIPALNNVYDKHFALMDSPFEQFFRELVETRAMSTDEFVPEFMVKHGIDSLKEKAKKLFNEEGIKYVNTMLDTLPEIKLEDLAYLSWRYDKGEIEQETLETEIEDPRCLCFDNLDIYYALSSNSSQYIPAQILNPLATLTPQRLEALTALAGRVTPEAKAYIVEYLKEAKAYLVDFNFKNHSQETGELINYVNVVIETLSKEAPQEEIILESDSNLTNSMQ